MLKTTTRPRRCRKSNVIQLPTRPHTATGAAPRMHDQEIISGKLFAFPLQRVQNARPMLVRDLPALPPLLDALPREARVIGEIGVGFPAAEQLSESLHMTLIAGDGLSRQAAPIVPVTDFRAPRTIGDMGRARTPVQFNKEFAMRLKAARIAAGYDTQKPFAMALGIEPERYKKWESGRTPIQHEYLTQVCELTGKDPNYFYGVQARDIAVKRTGT